MRVELLTTCGHYLDDMAGTIYHAGPATSTCCPGLKPCCASSCTTVTPGRTRAAACAKESEAGLSATWQQGH